MSIKPTYVTFEQAKFFKGKGLYFRTNTAFYPNGEVANYYPYDNLGENESYFWRPEQHQVVEWLRLKGIIIELLVDGWSDNNCVSEEFLCYRIFIWQIGKPKPHDDLGALPTPQKAYSVAFDYILNNNLI
jgi:hypothetical protein